MKFLRRWTPVMVHWVDSVGCEDGWTDEKDIGAAVHGVVSVGLVYRDASDRLTLVLSRDLNASSVCGYITIPKAAVGKVTVLRPA